MPNTNFQTIHQMGSAINSFVKQATGRDNMQNIDMEHITVAQNHYYEDVDISGRVVSFNAGAAGIPLDKCLVQIEPVQEGTGDPSPDNVRPITGWTGAKVTRTGKNLVSASSETRTQNGVTWICDGTSKIVSEGTATGNASFSPNIKPIQQRAGTFTASFVSDASGVRYSLVKNGAWLRTLQPGDSFTFNTIASDVITGYLSCNTGMDATGTSYIQIELGSTATAYEPYQGETYDIEFPSEAGTVYGGTLDVTNGVLTVDRAMVAIDGVNKTVRNNGLTSTTSNAWFSGAVGKAYGTINFISDRFAILTGVVTPYHMIGRDNSIGVEFMLPIDVPNTSSALNQWFADNPTQLAYELATPLTYQLTPQEVKSLLGINNIWADTGDIEVKFKNIKEFF